MDASLLEEVIAKNKPFKMTRKTSLLISYDENSAERFAIVPLLTITAAMAQA